MQEIWLNFAIVFLAQLGFFVVHVLYRKRSNEILHILLQSIFAGVVIGLLSDFLWGKLVGFWSYAPGYETLALILIGVLIYGLFVANILLLQHTNLLNFFVGTMLVMLIYEVTNNFFPVWTYTLTSSFASFLSFLIMGYFATAIFVAVAWHTFFGFRFHFIDALLKK